MMDRVQGCKLNVVLLGDLNIDMQKSNPAWNSTISLFGLDQMNTSPTSNTPHSSTLIDHIYISDTSIVSNTLVPATGISDHFPVCCTLSVKTVKPVLNVHSSIVYRRFKQFDERAFLMDLHVIPFENLYNFSDPSVALSHWIDLFLDVIVSSGWLSVCMLLGDVGDTDIRKQHDAAMLEMRACIHNLTWQGHSA